MTTTHTGACHCGAVRFETDVDLGRAIECNCSICAKHGLILSFTPAASFRLLQGEEALMDYRFNTMQIRHRFCRTCGVEPFGEGAMPDGTAMRAVNLRCLDGVDVHALSPAPFDGKSR